MPELWVDDPRPCPDPECEAMAEPEEDGDVRYWACACGYEFGHHQAAGNDDGCQLGIPENVRRAGTAPPEPGAPVLLQLGRRPE